MKLSDLRERALQAFGPGLQNATPANVREFVDAIHTETHAKRKGERYEMTEEKLASYEDILKDFFARALELPTDEAAGILWQVGLELAFALIEQENAERLDPLFRNLGEE